MSNIDKQPTIKEKEFNVDFPTSLVIGDPMYVEQNDEGCIFKKNYRGKKEWVGTMIIKEIEVEIDGENYTDISTNIFFAPTKELLEVYKDGCKLKRQRLKQQPILVDTAEYMIGTTNTFQIIRTGADGMYGSVSEFYTKNKLEGIEIEVGAGHLLEFKEFEEILKYVFSVK